MIPATAVLLGRNVAILGFTWVLFRTTWRVLMAPEGGTRAERRRRERSGR
jgi:hypothetical protein